MWYLCRACQWQVCWVTPERASRAGPLPGLRVTLKNLAVFWDFSRMHPSPFYQYISAAGKHLQCSRSMDWVSKRQRRPEAVLESGGPFSLSPVTGRAGAEVAAYPEHDWAAQKSSLTSMPTVPSLKSPGLWYRTSFSLTQKVRFPTKTAI